MPVFDLCCAGGLMVIVSIFQHDSTMPPLITAPHASV